MAIQVPVLIGIGMALLNFIRPAILFLISFLRHKFWFWTGLVVLFLGPFDFITDRIYDGLAWLIPEIEMFTNLAKNASWDQMAGAIQKVGQGAALANCVIAVDAFVAVGFILGFFITASLTARAAIFFYSMAPGKAT